MRKPLTCTPVVIDRDAPPVFVVRTKSVIACSMNATREEIRARERVALRYVFQEVREEP